MMDGVSVADFEVQADDSSRPRLFTPPFVLGTLANFFFVVIYYLFAATIASYAMDELGLGTSAAGLIAGVFLIGAVIGRMISGMVITIFGAVIGGVSCAGLMVACTVWQMLTQTIPGLMMARLFQGLTYAVAATALAGIVMTAVPPARGGEGSGWFGTGNAISTGVGPLLGTYLYIHAGARPLFWTGIGLSVAAFVLMVATIWGNPDIHYHPHIRGASKEIFGSVIAPRALPVGFAVLLSAFGLASILPFLTAHAQQIGMVGPARYYFLFYAVAVLVFRPMSGILQDRKGDTFVTVPAFVAIIVGVICTAYPVGRWMLWVGAALLGMGYGSAVSIGQTIAIAKVGRMRSGLAVGSYYLLVDGGTGLAPILLGPIASMSSYATMFAVGAGIATLGLVYYLAVVRRQRPKIQPGERRDDL